MGINSLFQRQLHYMREWERETGGRWTGPTPEGAALLRIYEVRRQQGNIVKDEEFRQDIETAAHIAKEQIG